MSSRTGSKSTAATLTPFGGFFFDSPENED